MRPFTKKIFTILVIFLAVRLAARYVLPLCFPFLLGAGLALIAEPAVNFFSGRLRMPRAAAAGIGVTAAFGAISLVLLFINIFGGEDAKKSTTQKKVEDAEAAVDDMIRQVMAKAEENRANRSTYAPPRYPHL